jgi:hypothetical protein
LSTIERAIAIAAEAGQVKAGEPFGVEFMRENGGGAGVRLKIVLRPARPPHRTWIKIVGNSRGDTGKNSKK